MPSKRSDAELDEAAARRERPLKVRARGRYPHDSGSPAISAELDPRLPPEITGRTPLARAWHDYERALDARIADAAITP